MYYRERNIVNTLWKRKVSLRYIQNSCWRLLQHRNVNQKRVWYTVLMCCLCASSYLYGKYSGPQFIEESDKVDVRSSDILEKLEHFKDNESPKEEQTDIDSSSQVKRSCSSTVPVPECQCRRDLLVPETEQDKCTDGLLKLENIKQMYGSSTCSDLATLRGANQSVISLSLWGAFPGEYYAGARILAERVKSVYPGWVLRLYHRMDAKQTNQHDWLCSMLCDFPHVDVCPVVNLTSLGDVSKSAGTIWRFLVVGDPLISRYAVRDADSPILQREVDAVNEWIKSGKCYHVMRDNKWHNVPMMGGMWGGCNWWQREEAVRARGNLLRTRVQTSDQISLWGSIWPLAQRNGISHDSHSCKRFKALPFPTQRFNFTFIGQRTYRAKHVLDRVWPPCPEECRPKDHKDWTYC